MIQFTKEERNIIAEFVYSEQSDILIISDAIRLIEVLIKHELITDKDKWMKRVKEKSNGVIGDLSMVLKTKITEKQGTEIMDEYFGKTGKNQVATEKVTEEKVAEQQNDTERWGVGKEGGSKSFDTVKISGEEFELIHGEYPHSRRDNTTYARSKDNPERIYGFDGHRLPFKIEIEETNYLKSSGLSGDEIRKSCVGKLFLNGVQIFDCGGRTYQSAFNNIQSFIDSMEMHWSWYPKKLEEWQGKIIKYEGQLFKIESFIVSQACMILVTPDGKLRKPFQSEQEDVENNDFDGTDTLKVEINSDHIWWYPTKKEIAQFK